jgi:hypothetical protein
VHVSHADGITIAVAAAGSFGPWVALQHRQVQLAPGAGRAPRG